MITCCKSNQLMNVLSTNLTFSANKLNKQPSIINFNNKDSFEKKSSITFGAKKLSDEQLNEILNRVINLDVKLSEDFYFLHSGPNKIDPEQLKTIQEKVLNKFLKDFNANVLDPDCKRAQILVNTGGAVGILAEKILLLKSRELNSTKEQKQLTYYLNGMNNILSINNPKHKIGELQYCCKAKEYLDEQTTKENEKLQLIALDVVSKYCNNHIARFFLMDDFILSDNKSIKLRQSALELLPEIVKNLNLKTDIIEEMTETLQEFINSCPQELKQSVNETISKLTKAKPLHN
ncbi:MAG: hypothetical protein AB1782_09545 [Cyanobacteriota bacterium]